MARIKDIPHVVNTVGVWTFLKRVYNQTYEDNLLVWAAALAYAWLFALFPFLIFCLSLVPLLPERVKPDAQTILNSLEDVLITGESLSTAAEPLVREIASPEKEANDGQGGEVVATQPASQPATRPDEASSTDDPAATPLEPNPADPVLADPLADPLAVAGAAPPEPATGDADARQADAQESRRRGGSQGDRPGVISNTVVTLVSDLINRPPSGLLTISLAIALFTASGGMAMTMAGLDKCYDVAWEKMRPIYKSRPIAMLLTIALVILILLTLIILPIGQVIIDEIARRDVGLIDLGWFSFFGRPLRWSVGLLLLFAGLAITYRFGPSVKTRLHLFSPGSIFAIVMWILTAYGFQFYISYLGAADSYARTYGAVAGVAFLMLLFYLDAFFLLVGAEINAEIDFIKLGIRSGDLPEEREIAPIPQYELDDEDRELKAELEDRRSVDESKPKLTLPDPQTGQPR